MRLSFLAAVVALTAPMFVSAACYEKGQACDNDNECCDSLICDNVSMSRSPLGRCASTHLCTLGLHCEQGLSGWVKVSRLLERHLAI
ncbi:hypothetical protein P692DRAFT_20832228 [Suillus brevipes Sb2]|nr:hypothetical protein P692DRAFT_20832228 [Suillus brevipes Sb2]